MSYVGYRDPETGYIWDEWDVAEFEKWCKQQALEEDYEENVPKLEQWHLYERRIKDENF